MTSSCLFDKYEATPGSLLTYHSTMTENRGKQPGLSTPLKILYLICLMLYINKRVRDYALDNFLSLTHKKRINHVRLKCQKKVKSTVRICLSLKLQYIVKLVVRSQ